MVNLVAYVDGSYNKDLKIYGCGLVLLDENNNLIQRQAGSGYDWEDVWQIAGEIISAEKAVEYAFQNGYDNLTLYYDYIGIQKWADHEWKTKKVIAQRYCRSVDYARRKGLNIKFVKVKSHTGNFYNEMADKLAKIGAKVASPDILYK